MSRIKDVLFTIEEMIVQGYDEVEIAQRLDLPVDMVQAAYDNFIKNEIVPGPDYYGM
jgi:hypothetical protein